MSAEGSQPMAGVFRIFFFLALAAFTATLVAVGVFSFYEGPEEESGFGRPQFDRGEESGFERPQFDRGESEAKANYDRNVGLILSIVGTAIMVGGVLALGARLNPLRTGLLVAGAGLLLGGVATGFDGSDDWLAFLMAALGFVTLLGSSRWLENGLPGALGNRPL